MDLQTHSGRDWLSTSWHRSREAGLTPRRLPQDTRLSQASLKGRQASATALIAAVEKMALPLFNQMFARTDSRLILTDTEGVILKAWGQQRFEEKLTAIALGPGSCWQEKLKGTNAIGTALVEAKPVCVMGDEHFIQRHRFISCSASPLFDHQGHLVGILDITSEQQRHDVATQVLVQNMVQLVENQMLSSIPHGSIRLDLAWEESLLNSGWQGIVIADANGEVLAQNQVASQLLAERNVVGCSLDDLLGNLHQSNELVFATRYLEKKQRRAKVVTPSCDLHHGDSTIEHAWQQANRVIDKGISLLIHGETGVGKGEFVKALHQQSARRNGPLVAVNCGALPKDLIESELFGYA
ncbi:sigma-54-dependent Fis family transcriptional regulator, partial [Vibrio sp.]|uniref:sigma-54-dependent Fis family transcriptional regulator n=1 Tax=Vibrio sp. TaxID=678 RepID=UPI003D10639B